MIVQLGLEVTQKGTGLQSTTKGLELVEAQAKRTRKATEEVSQGFTKSAKGATELAGAAGTAAKKLAGAADMFGLPAGALRNLDDLMDVTEIGFGGLSKASLSAANSMKGFWLAALGPVAAVAAAAVALGTFLNRFESIRSAADAAIGPMARFLGLAGEVNKGALTGIKDFSASMGKSHEGAIEKQVAQMREMGKSTKEILALYKDQRLSDELKQRLGLTEKTVKAEEAVLAATKKYKAELAEVNRIFKGENRGLVELYKAGTSVSSKDFARMLPGIATTFSPGQQVRGQAPQLRAMGEGAIATGLSLSYSQALDQRMKERADAEAKAKEGTDRLINTFGALAAQLTNLQGVVGGFAGKLLGILSSLSSGAGGIFSGIKAFGSSGGGLSGLLGKVTSSLGIVGSAVGLVGGVIGGIKSLFGGKSKEEKEAERQAKLQAQAEAKAAKEEAARLKLEGLRAAQSSAESLMGRMSGGNLSESLQAALGTILGKVQDALLKNGLGYMATGALRDSKGFGEAQGMAGDLAGVVRGMRQGGAVDVGLMQAGGVAAKELQAQAVAAAKEAGLSDAEAQKAGFGAVSDLLREQLNASIQSGQALDENTKAMIEEARKNGIEILADPAIEQLGVSKEMLGELKRMNSGGYRPPDESFASGTRGLRRLRSDMVAKVHAGEGMMVIPKDEMARMGYGSYSRGAWDDTYRDDRPGTLNTGDTSVTPSGGTGAGDSSGSTAYGGPSSSGGTSDGGATAIVAPTAITFAPQVTIQDNAQIRTAEGARAMERLAAKAIPEIIRQNQGGVQSLFREMIRREIREANG